MKNCLVTELVGTVSANLPKMGRMYIKFLASHDAATSMYISYWTNTPDYPEDNLIVIESGRGHLLNSNGDNVGQQLVANILGTGSTTFKVVPEGTDDVIVSLPNKYNLRALNLAYTALVPANDMKYLTYEKDGVVFENFIATVDGEFDVTNFKCRYLGISGTDLYGDCTYLIQYAGNWTYSNANKLFTGNKVSGDLSYLQNVNQVPITVVEGRPAFKWTTERSSDLKIPAFPLQVNFGSNLDAMLINVSAETINPDTSARTINVAGARTSASDAAVATLKEKGATVIVNGTTL